MIKGIFYVLIFIGEVTFLMVTVIFLVTKFSNKQARKTWLTFMIASIILILASIGYVIKNIVTTTKHRIEQIGEVFEDEFDDDWDLDTITDYNPSICRQIQLLKYYEPEKYVDKVPSNFYTYFGIRDHYRFPLRYPYSLNCIDTKDFGQICSELNVENIEMDDTEIKPLKLYDITNFAFDQNFFLAEINNKTSKNSYKIFDFNTEDIIDCKNKKEMFEKADLLGYSGNDFLMSIVDYSNLF